MDIVSHGLWGGLALGRENRKNFWWSFFFGVAPDLFSFGPFTAMTILGLASGPDWASGHPSGADVPLYVHRLYDFTHSLVIFAVIFGLIWFIRKKPFLPMFAWMIHVFMDIPTHSTEFFPTPFLWPFFDDLRISGIPWGHPLIFIPNVVLLVVLYLWFFVIKRRSRL